jgi:hypothetical protein
VTDKQMEELKDEMKEMFEATFEHLQDVIDEKVAKQLEPIVGVLEAMLDRFLDGEKK